MKISPNKFYWITMEVGDWKRRSRCSHLKMKRLKEDPPSYVVQFFDFESHRQIEGTLVEEGEDYMLFSIGGDKFYRFEEFRG